MNDIHELNPRALRLPSAQAALAHGLFAAVRRLPAGHRCPWQPRAGAGRRSHHPLSPSARLRSWPSRMRSCSLTGCTSTRSSRPRAGCGVCGNVVIHRSTLVQRWLAAPSPAGRVARAALQPPRQPGRVDLGRAQGMAGELPDLDDPGSHPPGPRLLPRLHASCDRPGSSLLDPVMCESPRSKSSALSGRACLAQSTTRSIFHLVLPVLTLTVDPS